MSHLFSAYELAAQPLYLVALLMSVIFVMQTTWVALLGVLAKTACLFCSLFASFCISSGDVLLLLRFIEETRVMYYKFLLFYSCHSLGYDSGACWANTTILSAMPRVHWCDA